MKKLRLFIDNFIIYGFGGIISKVIPLLMVPIVTRLVPDTAYYGLSDLSATIVSFCSSIAVMGMYDALFRLFFEEDSVAYQKRLCSTAFIFTVIISIIICMIMLLEKEKISSLFYGNSEYSYLIYICAVTTLVSSTNNIAAAPTRVQNKRSIYLLANCISPVLSYSISIPLLLKGYFIIALPLAAAVSSLFIEISFYAMNRKWFSLKRFDYQLLKQLLIIGLPLVPNILIYWIFNSSDKIMITNLIGIDAAGIYAVSSKMGHMSQLIYTAFAGGWQYFAFSTMKEKNQVENNSKVFEGLGGVSFAAIILFSAFSYYFFKILFSSEYLPGYKAASYLFAAPLLQMLYQVSVSQFMIIKKTWPNMIILSFGAVVNVALNLFLIPRIGIEGAAIATLAGYLVSDIICAVVLIKMKLMVIRRKFLIACLITIIYMIAWKFYFADIAQLGVAASMFAVAGIFYLYKDDLSAAKRLLSEQL